MVSDHTSDLIKRWEPGEALMSIDVLVYTIEVFYGEYSFYQYSIRGQIGAIISLPFFSYNKEDEQKFEGYLIYHKKNGYAYDKSELEILGLNAIANRCQAGCADCVSKLTPLPYNLISEDDIEDVMDKLIEKNTKVNLEDSLSL